MSFQPMQAPGMINPADPPTKSRRKVLLTLGLASLLVGIGAAVGLTLASKNQYKDGVQKLQRAPVGCDTQLDFSATGTFILYLETKGRIGALPGDCSAANNTYNHTDGRAKVNLSLIDDSGSPLTIDRAKEASYDNDGFVGTAIREVTIANPGSYTLSVSSESDDVAVAVGHNPKADSRGIGRIGLGVGLAGLLLGILLTLLGLRSGSAKPQQQFVPVPVPNPYGVPPSSYGVPPGAQPNPGWGTPPFNAPPPPPSPSQMPYPAPPQHTTYAPQPPQQPQPPQPVPTQPGPTQPGPTQPQWAPPIPAPSPPPPPPVAAPFTQPQQPPAPSTDNTDTWRRPQ